jgi:hypothetical protein
MAVVVSRDTPRYLNPKELEDGQLGRVVRSPIYRGRVVQRHGDNLISVGLGEGDSWTGACGAGSRSTIEIEPLVVGDNIEVVCN